MSDETVYGRERYRRITLAGNAWAETWLQRRGQRVTMHWASQTPSGSGSGGTGGYQRCSEHGCLGEALENAVRCFSHATDSDRAEILKQLPRSGKALQLRGASISQVLWNEIAASPLFENGKLRAPISMAGAEIDASIRLVGVAFDHHFELSSAVVTQHVELKNCSFNSHLIARYALFDGGTLNCDGSTFHEPLDLSFSKVESTNFGFQGCIFERLVNLDGFTGTITLSDSSLRGNVTCRSSKAWLIINGCDLQGTLDLSSSELSAVHGERLLARSAIQLGPCAVGNLHLPRSIFEARVHMEVVAKAIDLTGAMMKEGGLLLIEEAKVRLTQLSLGGPLRVSGRTSIEAQQPEILSLFNSDAGRMSLSKVNLTRCSFVGAHGLGTLDIDSTATFARAPFWAGSRRFIADEFAWRGSTGWLRRSGWVLEGVQVGFELPKLAKGGLQPILLKPLLPSEVATLYRELRRALETKSDMPGAADFYYGEMEMRRWGGARTLTERVLLWCYWLFSGYGLRPLRALLAWLLLIILGTASFVLAEPQPPDVHVALLTAIRASIPGLSVTGLGQNAQWVEIVVRVFGTLFIALFLLSIRSLVLRKPSE